MKNQTIAPVPKDCTLIFFCVQAIQLLANQVNDEDLYKEFGRLSIEHAQLYKKIDSFNSSLASKLTSIHLDIFLEPTKLYDEYSEVLETLEKEDITCQETFLKINDELQQFNHRFKNQYPDTFVQYADFFKEYNIIIPIKKEKTKIEDVLETEDKALSRLKKGILIFLILALSLILLTMSMKNYLFSKTSSNNLETIIGTDKTSKNDIESALASLEQMAAKHEESAIDTKASQNYEATKQLYEKTAEELKATLLAPVKARDRNDFYKELESRFKVGKHKDFLIRQIANCQNKLDLAIVGMGIIRIDEVLKGENPTVLDKDRVEFIKYIRDQVQLAIASTDQNYKSIVFKGLESSSN